MTQGPPEKLTGALALCLLAGAAFLLGGSCNSSYWPCEEDIDCLLVCECANGYDAVLGPFPCRAGTCGPEHAEQSDCIEACTGVRYVHPDDDDSAGDDDDSAGDDSAE